MDLSFQLGKIFRRIERTTGTGKMSMAALRAISEAIGRYNCKKDWSCFLGAYTQLLQSIEHTQPRFSVIIDGAYKIYQSAIQQKIGQKPYSPERLQQIVQKIIRSYAQAQEKIVRHGVALIQDKDVILLYDHSTTVGKILTTARRKHRKFEVIIAKQAEEKTNENIEFCLQEKIPFKVIPTYMLTHIEKTITKVFTGVVTLKNSFRFIMDPGSQQVISEFLLRKTPRYAFLQTTKFSLWEDSGKKIHDVHIKEKTVHHEEHDLNYEFMSFSHDRVDSAAFTAIITEEGIFSPREIRKIFTERFEERKKLKKQIMRKK